MVATRDGRRAYVGCNDGSIRVLDLEAGSQITEFRDHNGCIYTLAKSGDEKYLASCGADLIARIWNRETGEVFSRAKGHADCVHGLAFSTDASWFATGGGDGTVRSWNSYNGQPRHIFGVPVGVKEHIHAAAISPDGRWVAGSGNGKSAAFRVWNAADGRLVREYGKLPETPMESVVSGNVHSTGSNVQFLPDGDHLISCGKDKTIRIFERESGNELYKYSFDQGVNQFTLSSDGRRAVTGHIDGSVRVWLLPHSTQYERKPTN